MKRLLILFLLFPVICFGQYRADRARTNPVVSDGNGYCFRGHLATATGAYCAEATALFARMTTVPTDARKAVINNFIVGAKAAGIWQKWDAVYVLAASDQQSALLNWIADTNNATTINAPAFKIDTGYAGGVGTINTHYNPTQDAVNFAQDDASSLVYISALGATGDNRVFGALSGDTWYYLSPSFNNVQSIMSVNSTQNHLFYPLISELGLAGISRSSATTEVEYRTDGTSTYTENSNGLLNENIGVLGLWFEGNGYGLYGGTVSFFCVGSSFSQTNYDALATLVETYMDAVGCGKP